MQNLKAHAYDKAPVFSVVLTGSVFSSGFSAVNRVLQ